MMFRLAVPPPALKSAMNNVACGVRIRGLKNLPPIQTISRAGGSFAWLEPRYLRTAPAPTKPTPKIAIATLTGSGTAVMSRLQLTSVL
jgi:hypothetical protein